MGGGQDDLNHNLQMLALLPGSSSWCQVAAPRAFLRAELLTFANSCPQWSYRRVQVPGQSGCGRRGLPTQSAPPRLGDLICPLATHAHGRLKGLPCSSIHLGLGSVGTWHQQRVGPHVRPEREERASGYRRCQKWRGARQGAFRCDELGLESWLR